uniref:TonB-dependent transporter Oar-like beta-barrel domain-containing protein n=1 Tax=Acidobacterium capsulatum TaxID=33075 RepID=A0A7V5CT43_9BACT
MGVACAWLWMCAAAVCAAQWGNGGSMAGRILDGDGAPVEHARLMIEALDSGTTYDLGTDPNGNFLLPQLAPGAYKVAVEAPGFAAWTLPDVEVTAGQERELSPRLESLMAKKPVSGSASQRAGKPVLTLSMLQRQAGQRSLEVREPALAEPLAMREPEAAPAVALMAHPPAAVSTSQIYMRLRNAQTVHARVSVTTPQGLVEAAIAEKPVVPAGTTDWAAFEPGRKPVSEPTSQAASRPAGQQVSESASQPGGGFLGAVHIQEQPDVGARANPHANHGATQAADSDSPGVPPVPPLNEHMTVDDSTAAATTAEDRETTASRSVPAKSSSGTMELAEAFAPEAPERGEQDQEQSDIRLAAVTNSNGGAGAELNRAARSTSEDEVSAFEPAGEDAAEVSERSRSDSTDSFEVRSNHSVDRVHGQTFVEDRDAAWGAENAGTTLTTQTAAGAFVTTPYKPADRRLQAALELGGPFGANGRGHWFVAVDGLQRNNPGMAVVSEPSKFFAPLTSSQLQTLQARLQGGMSAALDTGQAEALYTQTMGQLDGLLGSVARSTRQVIAFPRLDWKLNDRNRISVGYDFIRLTAHDGVWSAPTETWGTGSFGTRTLALDSVSGKWNTFVTPNLLNELRYTVAHDVESEMPVAPSGFEQALAKNPLGMTPQISVASGSGGFRFGTPSYLDKTAYPDEFRQEAADTLTWVRGRNQLSMGYALDYARDGITGLNYGAGGYSYSTREAFVADLLSPNHCDASTTGTGNLPCWSRYEQTVGPNSFRFDTADYAGFATDTLKLRAGLTLSAGARYDYEHLPNPNTALVNAAIPETASLPSGGNVSPRVGFAWALPWRGRRPGAQTVVRGGVGVFYGRISNVTVLNAISQTGAADAERNYIFKPLDTGAPQFPVVFSAHPDLQIAPNVTYFATGFQHARALQAQFSVEQSLGRNTTLTLSYWGSFGSDLPQVVDENIDLNAVGKIAYTVNDPAHMGPLTGTYESKFFYKRLNANFNQMAEMQSTARSRYQAAGVSLRSRLPHGMLLTLDYRNAHALDDSPYATAYNGRWMVEDPSNLALDWGTSNSDIRDRLTGGLVLHEPWHASGWAESLLGGYTLDVTGGYRSGRPYTMRTVGAVPSFACSYQGWLEAGNDCVLSAPSGVITGVPVPVESLGASLNGAGGASWLPGVGRNTYRYPAAFDGNLRFAKRTGIGGRKALEFGADVSNFMNHSNVTHLETVGYVLSGEKSSTGAGKLTYLSGANGHSQFGVVTTRNNNSTYRDRQIELVLRLIF